MFFLLGIALLAILPPLLLFGTAKFSKLDTVAHPLRVMAWVLLIAYTFKSLYLVYAIPAGVDFRTGYFTADYIHLGQLMALLGVIFMILGYFAATQLSIRLPSFNLGPLRRFVASFYWPIFALSLFGVAVVFYLKGLHTNLMNLQFTANKFHISEATGTRSSLGFALLGADIIVVYFLYYLTFAKRVIPYSVYVFAVAFVALNFFMSSQRMGVIIIVMGALLVAKTNLFDLRTRQAWIRLITIGLVISVLSVASSIRQERREVGLSELSVTAGIQATIDHAFKGLYAIDPSKLTGIALRHDEYLYGQSFLMFIVAPIPRVLWPDKPNVRIGPYVAQDLLDFRNNSGTPPSAIGEFYINFGWVGIALGMMIFGALLANIRKGYSSAQDKEQGRVKYALAIMVMIYFMIGDFSYAMLFFIKYSFASFICQSYWAQKPKPRIIKKPNIADQMGLNLR